MLVLLLHSAHHYNTALQRQKAGTDQSVKLRKMTLKFFVVSCRDTGSQPVGRGPLVGREGIASGTSSHLQNSPIFVKTLILQKCCNMIMAWVKMPFVAKINNFVTTKTAKNTKFQPYKN